MRLMKQILLALVLLMFALPASAQTVTFTQQNVASAAQAGGFTYRLYVTPSGNPTQNAPVVIPNVTCTGTTIANCTAPLPTAAIAALVTGAKSVLTAQDTVNGSVESLPSPIFMAGATAPSGFKITP